MSKQRRSSSEPVPPVGTVVILDVPALVTWSRRRANCKVDLGLFAKKLSEVIPGLMPPGSKSDLAGGGAKYLALLSVADRARTDTHKVLSDQLKAAGVSVIGLSPTDNNIHPTPSRPSLHLPSSLAYKHLRMSHPAAFLAGQFTMESRCPRLVFVGDTYQMVSILEMAAELRSAKAKESGTSAPDATAYPNVVAGFDLSKTDDRFNIQADRAGCEVIDLSAPQYQEVWSSAQVFTPIPREGGYDDEAAPAPRAGAAAAMLSAMS